MTLKDWERHAIDAILDRVSADPDDDAAIAARAALREAAEAERQQAREKLLMNLIRRLGHHGQHLGLGCDWCAALEDPTHE